METGSLLDGLTVSKSVRHFWEPYPWYPDLNLPEPVNQNLLLPYCGSSLAPFEMRTAGFKIAASERTDSLSLGSRGEQVGLSNSEAVTQPCPSLKRRWNGVNKIAMELTLNFTVLYNVFP